MEYILAFLLLLAVEYGYICMAKRLGIVDRPHLQSSHKGKVVRGGGMIFYVAFLAWSVFSGWPYPWMLVGQTLLAGVSFVDDIHDVSPKVRLLFQFAAILLMFYEVNLLAYNLHVIIFLAVACVGAVNIYNFMDGINGLTGGYSLVVALSLLYFNEMPKYHFIDSSLIVMVILSIVVFCVFNFRRRAKCFAGDVGSLSIGFILVFLILKLVFKMASMSCIALVSVYLVDGGLTILHRILLRENLMKPHKKHAYQIMANELQMPHLQVSLIYMGFQALCSAWFIIKPGFKTIIPQFILLSLLYLWFMKKYYHLHTKKLYG